MAKTLKSNPTTKTTKDTEREPLTKTDSIKGTVTASTGARERALARASGPAPTVKSQRSASASNQASASDTSQERYNGLVNSVNDLFDQYSAFAERSQGAYDAIGKLAGSYDQKNGATPGAYSFGNYVGEDQKMADRLGMALDEYQRNKQADAEQFGTKEQGTDYYADLLSKASGLSGQQAELNQRAGSLAAELKKYDGTDDIVAQLIQLQNNGIADNDYLSYLSAWSDLYSSNGSDRNAASVIDRMSGTNVSRSANNPFGTSFNDAAQAYYNGITAYDRQAKELQEYLKQSTKIINAISEDADDIGVSLEGKSSVENFTAEELMRIYNYYKADYDKNTNQWRSGTGITGPWISEQELTPSQKRNAPVGINTYGDYEQFLNELKNQADSAMSNVRTMESRGIDADGNPLVNADTDFGGYLEGPTKTMAFNYAKWAEDAIKSEDYTAAYDYSERALQWVENALEKANADYDAHADYELADYITNLENIQKRLKYAYSESSIIAKTERVLERYPGFEPTIDRSITDGLYSGINGTREGESLYEKRTHITELTSDHVGSTYNPYETMTDDERKAYNILYEVEGPKAAKEYYDSIKRDLEARASDKNFGILEDWSAEHPGLATVGSFGLTLPRTVSGGYDIVAGVLGGDIDTKSGIGGALHSINRAQSSLRTGSKRDMNWLGQTGYDIAVSAIDSAINAAFAKFIVGDGSTLTIGGQLATAEQYNEVVANCTSLVMGMEVVSDSMVELTDRGYDSRKALAISVARGAIEWATEKWSIENILDDPDGFRSQLAQSFFTEGSEEVASNVLNNILDLVTNDSNGVWVEMQNRIKAGMDPAEAIQLAFDRVSEEDALAFISGAFSGAGMTMAYGGAAVAENISARVDSFKQGVQDFADENKKKFGSEEAYSQAKTKLAQETVEANKKSLVSMIASLKLKNGSEISDTIAAMMTRQNVKELAKADLATVKSAVREQLINSDVSSSKATKIATAIANVYWSVSSGSMPKISDIRTATSTEVSQRILKEIGNVAENEWVQHMESQMTSMKSTGSVNEAMRITKEMINSGTKKVGSTSRAGVGKPATINASGERGTVKGIAIDEKGNATVNLQTESGTRQVNIQDVSIDDVTMDLVSGASQFGYNGNVILQSYLSGQDVYKYIEAAGMVAAVAESSTGDGTKARTYLKNNSQVTKALEASQIDAIFDSVRSKAESRRGEGKITRGTGVVDTSKIRGVKLTKKQQHSINAIRVLAQVTKVDFEFFSSETDDDGHYKGKNGSYIDGKITLDIHAQMSGPADFVNNAVLRTASHELTHWLKESSPKQYAELRNFVVEKISDINKYYNNGTHVTLDYLIDRQIAKSTKKETMTRDQAIDEIVADSCEMMILNSKVLEDLAYEHFNLFKKIKYFFDNFLNDIQIAMEGMDEFTEEAKYMKQFNDELVEKWDAAFNYAVMRRNSVSEETAKALASEGMTVEHGAIMGSDLAEEVREEGMTTPNDKEKEYESTRTLPKWLKNYLKTGGDQSIADAIIEFGDKIMADPDLAQYVPWGEYKYSAKGMGPLRKNVEYKFTFDMDTSCPRTFEFLNYRDQLQKRFGRPLTFSESINLLEVMKAFGRMIPCTYCYVENKRIAKSESYNYYFERRAAVMSAADRESAFKEMYSYDEKKGTVTDAARKVFDQWMQEVEEGTAFYPTAEETWTLWSSSRNAVLNYLDGMLESGSVRMGPDVKKKTSQKKLLEMTMKQFGVTEKPAIAETTSFVQEWIYDKNAGIQHKYSTDNVNDTFSQKHLVLHRTATNYSISSSMARTIDSYVPYTDELKNISAEDRAYINGMGGIRIHSSNDFRMDYVVDYLQFFADLAKANMYSHLYTKSIDFVKIFGRTGARINMSVAFTTDPNTGKVVENLNEGMSHKKARELRAAYKDAGVMAMVTDNAQLEYALRCDWIDMIIPFHASGLKQAVWLKNGWADYTQVQLESWLNTTEKKEALKAKGVEFLESKDFKKQSDGDYGEYIDNLYNEAYGIKTLIADDGTRIKPHFFPRDTYQKGVLVPGHHNDANRYRQLCEEYGVHPRFYGLQMEMTDESGNRVVKDVTEHPNYLKLIKETARTDTEQQTVEFNLNKVDENLKVMKDGKMQSATPMEWAMDRLRQEQRNGGYSNVLNGDPAGVVKHFEENYKNVTDIGLRGKDVKRSATMARAYDEMHDKYEVPEAAMRNAQNMKEWNSDREATKDIVEIASEESTSAAIEQVQDVQYSLLKERNSDRVNETYSMIGKEVMSYAEGNRKPDLTLVNVYNERTGKTETTIKFVGEKPANYVPKRIAYCYKLFEQHPDGSLHALFAGAGKPVTMNEWIFAQGFPYTDAGVAGMNLRERYGWHLSAGLPSAPHLMSSKEFERGYPSKGAYGHPKGSKRVWVRMMYDASTDFNAIADQTKEGDIFGLIPFGGYYAFKENNQSEWVISSAVKIDKVLSEEERQEILKAAGWDEHEKWLEKYGERNGLLTDERINEIKAKKAAAKKAADEAKKEAKKSGVNFLSESARQMCESIKSRIIDNPELVSERFNSENGDIRYSDRDVVSEITVNDIVSGADGTPYVNIQTGNTSLTRNKPWLWSSEIKSLIIESLSGKLIVTEDGDYIYVGVRGAREVAYGTDTIKMNNRRDFTGKTRKMIAAEHAASIIWSSKDVGAWSKNTEDETDFYKRDGINYRRSLAYIDGKPYSITVVTAINLDELSGENYGEKFYDLVDIKIDGLSTSGTASQAQAINPHLIKIIENPSVRLTVSQKERIINRNSKNITYTSGDTSSGSAFAEAFKKAQEKNSDRDNLQAAINNEEKILDILDSLRAKGISSAQNKAIAQLINLASSTGQIADELRDVARLSGNTELERLHAIERMIKRENFLKSQISAAEEMVQKEKANTEKVKAADTETIEKRDERIKKLKQDLADLRKQKNERIDEIRADRDRKLSELLERKNQQIQDNQTGRRRTAIIHKIQRLESKLTNDIRNRTDKGAFYPTTLITACIDALQLLNTSGESKFEYEDVDGYMVPHEANKAKLKYQSIKEALNDLKTEYDALKGSTDYDYASEYESEMSELIGELAKAIGNKPVREMSIQQVEDVYSVLKDIDTVISNAKHQLGTQDRITNYELAEGVVSEMRAQKGNANWYSEMKTRLSNEVLSPMRLINRITGYNPDSVLMDLTNKLNDGLKVANAFKMDAVKMFDELRTGENEKRFADACNNEEEWNVSLTSETGLPTGEKLRMTHMQALQVVMSWDREHLGKTSGTKHMEEGGLIIPDQNLLKKGKVRDAVINGQRVSFLKDEDIFAIREQLTEYDKRFMSAAEQYFNVLAKDEINKTMLTLKGRIKATEDHYIPFKVDDGTIDAKMDALTYDASIMSYGMLKSITTGASNALIMEGLNQVLGKHIDSASKIVGIAIPVRNFQKVYNTRMRGGNSTVHDAIGRTWGAGTEDAIEQMVADIQANRKHERSTLGDVLDFSQNVFVQSTLAGNISVTIKQAASYSTAGLHLSQRALFPFQATVMRLFVNNKSEFAQNLFAEIDRYTPEHWLRRQGLSTQEIGDRAIRNGTLSSTVNKIPDALNPMRWIQNMDVATTAALWLACKEQVAIDGTNESAGDEYWTKVTQLYEKVIEETQPMYDSMHRAEVQKSTNALQRQVVMFQTQPLQNSGIIYDAYGNLKAAMQSNDESLKKSAKQKFGRAVLSQVSSSIVFATMTFLAYLLKGKSKRYRDKDDEISAWSILKRMGLDVSQTWTSLFAPAVGSYLFDFVDRLVNGNKWYDLVSVPAVDTINDFAESIINFGNAFSGDKIDWNKAGAQAWNISEQVAHMFGIPAENIYTLISGTVNNAKSIVTGKEGFFSNDIQRDDSEQVNRMWSGITSGNGELYKEAFNQLVASLKETKGYGRDEAIAEAQSKLARRVTDQQKKGNISEREAARYYEKYCGMERDEAELKAAVNAFKYFNKDYASWLNDGGNDLSNEQIVKLIESEANPKEVFRIMKREGMTFSKALAEAAK